MRPASQLITYLVVGDILGTQSQSLPLPRLQRIIPALGEKGSGIANAQPASHLEGVDAM